jgi:hypothetical protein
MEENMKLAHLQLWTVIGAAFVILVASGPMSVAADETPEASVGAGGGESVAARPGNARIELFSYPLATPIKFPGGPLEATGGPLEANVTSIQITGEVPEGKTGPIRVVLDSSKLDFNQFGDARVVEAKPPQVFEVQLVRQSQTAHEALFEIPWPLRPRVYLHWQMARHKPSQLIIGQPDPLAASDSGYTRLRPIQIIPLQDISRDKGAISKEPLPADIAMHSSYFLWEQARLGHIQLQGRLGGPGSLTHDMNQLQLMGMSFSSTLLKFRDKPITIEPTGLPDPLNQKRRLFRIVFAEESPLGEVFLVIYPAAAGPHRLIIRKDSKTQHVLAMSAN